ncbi:hypothetical protein GOP47_0023953 [Adiantum capillus-veneris]|uniref:Uncharacterized protein n=1 Tax=Adiantum capillus-veneris TaxID=13818 RepID=A0A9D4Z3U5_ADICA|nr:hypothetical protein GOP47_0023953 [Adiantum capillus-veneris]
MNLLRRVEATRKVVASRSPTSFVQTLPQQQYHKQETPAEEGNITRQNFWGSLESFKAHLRSADFVGFDLELSGVHSVPTFDPSCSDLGSPLHHSYRRIKHLAEKFTVFQVGFALFHLDPVCNRFLAYPYNFYVFPRNDLHLGLPATSLSCEASALEFLASHGFDFNLCIQDGISYLSKTQEVEARALLVNELSPFRLNTCNCSRTINNTSDIVFAEKLRANIEKWHNSICACSPGLRFPGRELAANFLALSKGQIKDFEVPSYGINQCPSFTLQLENHHQVCLAQMVVEKHFKDLVPAIRSDCGSGSSHDVKFFFAKSKEHLDFMKHELEQDCEQTSIKKAVGFRYVVDAIVSSQKPLIGHNCALDLAHIHSKFLSPLPSHVEEFAASLLSNFPSIIDTKCLMRLEPSLQAFWAPRVTSLNVIYSRMFKSKNMGSRNWSLTKDTDKQPQRVQVDIMDGFKRYQDTNTNHLHEAGYDAFMTGCVFAQICQQLHVNVKDLLSAAHDTSKFLNLLNMGRGVLDLNTGKPWETDAVKEDPNQTSVSLTEKEPQCAED